MVGECMDNFIVNVPVKINIWIRPECQQKQWEVIKKVKPSVLFIISDGGRNKKEWDAIISNRKMIDSSIDWKCIVYRMYEEKNNGLYTMIEKLDAFVWDKVDRCIFLEDDQIPSVSFFYYCAELLEKYKDDERIECICGMNHLGISSNVTADYFFSRQGSIWGTATWKRVYELRNKFDYYQDSYIMSLLKERTKHNKHAWDTLENYGKGEKYDGHIPGDEFWREFNMYGHNMLQIIPKRNMISNIGCTNEAAHSGEYESMVKGVRRVFNMPIYELSFPLSHPQYVIPDIDYERKRNRIMAYNSPMISTARRWEGRIHRVKTYGLQYIGKKIKQKLELRGKDKKKSEN